MATEPASSNEQLVLNLCRDYGSWAPDLTSPPSPGARINGGHNHFLQIINSPGQQWVARIALSNLRDRAQRSLEAAIQQLAADAGIAPAIVFNEAQSGVTVMDYIDGDRDHQSSTADLAALFRKIHSLPARGPVMSSCEVLEQHQRLIANDEALGKLFQRGDSKIRQACDRLKNSAEVNPVLCHNDLLAANRIRSGAQLYALDWEYAAPGDPFFDLAACASELPDEAAVELLTEYLERDPSVEETQRYEGQRLVYACIEACWFSAHARGTSSSAEARHRLLKVLNSGDSP